MTTHQQAPTRFSVRAAPGGSPTLAALLLAMSLAGCGGDGDDTPTIPASTGSTAQPLTAPQIATAQAALDAQSAPLDATSAGSTTIAASQSALDDQAGLAKEAGF